jgi:hypothetical protein
MALIAASAALAEPLVIGTLEVALRFRELLGDQ